MESLAFLNCDWSNNRGHVRLFSWIGIIPDTQFITVIKVFVFLTTIKKQGKDCFQQTEGRSNQFDQSIRPLVTLSNELLGPANVHKRMQKLILTRK